MLSQYGSIASIYDNVNSGIDYTAWADFIEKCFEKYMKIKPEIVLDLACGTGSMTFELYSRGYDMIGADMSEDMLTEALDKAYDMEISDILFLKQDMRSFELYGTVGAIVCCLDSVNYLTADGDMEKCFRTVHNYLDPDGLFIFDVNTPYKFKHVYADNSYIFEDETSDGRTAFCGWQNDFDEETGLCNFYLNVFTEEEDGRFSRAEEVQTERCYGLFEITKALDECGMEFIGAFGDFSLNKPTDTAERWYIVARAKK